jgi:hypothetical protein
VSEGGNDLSHYPKPATRAPFDLTTGVARWLFDVEGRPFPIAARSRRRIVIDRCGFLIPLKRRRLESIGHDVAGDGTAYYVTTYLQETV